MGQAFNTCKPIQSKDDIDKLYLHLMNGFSYMAMTNYPYSSSFLTPMPAWPVNVSCKYFKDFEPSPEIKSEEPSYAQAVGGINP